MKGPNTLDPIDRNILRVLSLYEELDVLQLWYELGETDRLVERMTREELLERLKFLGAEGFVRPTGESQGGTQWCLTIKGEVKR